MKNFYKTEHSVVFENSFCDWETGELLSPIQTQNYMIVQVAELYYNNAFCIGEHFQYNDLELTFPTTNGLSCATDGEKDKLQKHEIYLSFKGDRHELTSRYGCRFQAFAINFISPASKALFQTLKERFCKNKKHYSPDAAPFFTAIISEFLAAEQPFFLQNLDSLITSVLVRLARAKTPTSDTVLSTQITASDIRHHLDARFLDICSLEELSARFGYTYGYICKIFKKEFNVTPVEYLLTKKMDHTVLLLSQGKTLSEIAEATGYSTPYNLSRAFKKKFGVSPNEFKKARKTL